MHFYLSIFWKDTKKDKNKYFSLLTVSDLNDGYGEVHRRQPCQVITAKCSHQLLQTNDTRGLPSPAFKGNRSAVLKKKSFPSSARGSYRRRHGWSSQLCQLRTQGAILQNSDGLWAVLLGPRQRYIHQATFDLAIITYVCIFLDKNIYFYKKLIIQL